MDAFPWALLAKPVLYWGVFQTARAWSDGTVSPWQPVLAALWRVIFGLVIGIPVAVVFAGFGETGVLVAFSAFRFLLWLLILATMFEDLYSGRRALLAFAATGLNWAVDRVAFGGLWTDLRIFGA